MLKKYSLALKIALTLVAFAIVFHQVDWNTLRAALATQQTHYIALAFLLVLVQAAFGGLRWHQLLAALVPLTISFVTAARYYFSSLLFNIYMPGTLGSDMSRVILAKNEKTPTSTLVASVIFDRIFSLLATLVMVLIFLPNLAKLLSMPIHYAWLITLIGAVCVMLGFIFARAISAFVLARTRHKLLLTIAAPLHTLMHHKLRVLSALAFATFAHCSYCLAIYLLAQSLALPLTYLQCLTLIPLVMLLSGLPISLSGWGVREIGMTTALAIIAIPAEPALIISLQIGLLTTALNLLGGGVYMGVRKS